MLRRFRVIPDEIDRSLVLSGLGWGVVASFGYALSEPILNLSGSGGLGSEVARIVGSLSIIGVPFLLFAVWSSVRVYGWLPYLAVSAAFLMGYMAGVELTYAWASLMISLHPALRLGPNLWACGIGLPLWLLVMIVVRLFIRTVVLSAVRQTGALCYGCGYDLTGVQRAALCPECARPQQSIPGISLSKSADSIVVRLAIPAAAACAFLGPFAYCVRWSMEVSPLRNRLGNLGCIEYFDDFIWSPNMGATYRSYAGFIPLDISHHVGMVIAVAATTAEGHNAVQVRLAALGNLPTGEKCLLIVQPQVICNLTERQALQLFAKGIPESLTKEFESNAINVQIPKAAQSMYGIATLPITANSKVVDPDKYFMP